MMASYHLRQILCVIFFGLWLGQFNSYSLLLNVLWLVIIFLSWKIWPKHLVGLCVLGVSSFFYGTYQPPYSQHLDTLNTWHNQVITLTGTVNSWPEKTTKSQRVYLEVSHPSPGRVLITLPRDQILKYGDQITLTGKITKPQNFDQFDYRRYLARFHVYSVIRSPKNLKITSRKNWLVAGRSWFEGGLEKHLPSPNQELAAGVLIGTKHALPEPINTYFKQSGLQHLIVVSGSNVVILMALVAWLLRPVGPWLNIGVSSLVLGSFVFITGAEPPVLRAGIFGLIMIIALNLGQFVDIRNLLLLAAVLLGLSNPLIIQYDVSFWLSFSATAGIILGFPIYQKISQSWPIWTPLKYLFGVSFVAQIAVLPVLIMTFEKFPWVGLISNLFAEPIIPIAMGGSLLAGFSNLFPAYIGAILSVPALMATNWLVSIAHFFGPWPPLILPPSFGMVLSIVWAIVGLWALFSPSYELHFWNLPSQILDDNGGFTDHDPRK